MKYAIAEEVRRANPSVFPHMVDGERVFVKQRRPAKNPLGHAAQRFLYALTGNLLVMPPGPYEGNPVAFETGMLRKLGEMDIRVPRVLHEEHDYFVMSDAGPALDWHLGQHPESRDETIGLALLELRRLHQLGFAHGGAQVKNFTWKDNEIYFIDFETYVPSRLIREFQVRDIFLFLFSLERLGHNPDLTRLCELYDGAPGGTTQAAMQTCLLGLRPVRIMDHRLFAGVSMRDVRALSSLVRKAQDMAGVTH